MHGVSKDGSRRCRLWPILRRGQETASQEAEFLAPPFINIKFFGFRWTVIPVPKTSLILTVSCSTRGRFLEAILQRIERELAGPGRPGTVDGLVAGGALGGAAPCHGRARSHHAARGGLTTRLKGAHWCPGASHRSTSSRVARDWQTSGALRRENVDAWLFENLI